MQGKYSPQMADKICELFEMNKYTNKEICKIVGINQDTFYEWRQSHPEFSEKMEKSRARLIEKRLQVCEASLNRLIEGYVTEDVVTEYVNIDGKPVIRGQRVVKHNVPPSLGAIIHYQTNRDPENWANRQRMEVTGKGGEELKIRLPKLSEEDFEELKRLNEQE